ncbi:hypothetical protein [Dactylosporangium sp. NPDC050588]|uniref:hypothetical protein n=1 Tax=Dactylosporangium sp. NPDC050588 TaxID=3157211 RepID=UPI00340AD0F2
MQFQKRLGSVGVEVPEPIPVVEVGGDVSSLREGRHSGVEVSGTQRDQPKRVVGHRLTATVTEVLPDLQRRPVAHRGVVEAAGLQVRGADKLLPGNRLKHQRLQLERLHRPAAVAANYHHGGQFRLIRPAERGDRTLPEAGGLLPRAH